MSSLGGVLEYVFAPGNLIACLAPSAPPPLALFADQLELMQFANPHLAEFHRRVSPVCHIATNWRGRAKALKDQITKSKKRSVMRRASSDLVQSVPAALPTGNDAMIDRRSRVARCGFFEPPPLADSVADPTVASQ
jgi:hypothetical protein